jgi:GTP cyclohydrolase I
MIDRAAAARAITDFLKALGYEPTGELEGTGARVADAWADDLIHGQSIDAAALLRDGSIDAPEKEGQRALIVVRDLSVTTMCPHHLLPAHGVGLVAYAPGPRIAGIGVIALLLDALARRLTLQETIGEEVAGLLVRELGARGALCKLALTHMCLVARGERKTGSVVETLAVAGSFAEPTPDRDLALAALNAMSAPSPSSRGGGMGASEG